MSLPEDTCSNMIEIIPGIPLNRDMIRIMLIGNVHANSWELYPLTNSLRWKKTSNCRHDNIRNASLSPISLVHITEHRIYSLLILKAQSQFMCIDVC